MENIKLGLKENWKQFTLLVIINAFVGGMVGLIGGLGGFVCPIIFGYLLEGTGLWTSCWMFILALSVLCLWWMNKAIHKDEAVH